MQASPVIEIEGLKSHEIALLLFLMENLVSADDSISAFTLKNEMNKAGYTAIATSVGIRTLEKNGMVITSKVSDYNDNEYIICRLTDKGENWILSNQDQLEFRRSNASTNDYDELPF